MEAPISCHVCGAKGHESGSCASLLEPLKPGFQAGQPGGGGHSHDDDEKVRLRLNLTIGRLQSVYALKGQRLWKRRHVLALTVKKNVR